MKHEELSIPQVTVYCHDFQNIPLHELVLGNRPCAVSFVAELQPAEM